jgi:hypothetical protein
VTLLVERRSVVVLALGTAQTLAWASSYYLVAIAYSGGSQPVIPTQTSR